MKKRESYIGPDIVIIPPTHLKMTKKQLKLFMQGYTPLKREWVNTDEIKEMTAPKRKIG